MERELYLCFHDARSHIIEKIEELDLHRIVIASCTPITHEPLFRETLKEAGLNPYLLEIVNLREQCSWVHIYQPKDAINKVKDLLRSAVSKARLLDPLPRLHAKVKPVALVIGGGFPVDSISHELMLVLSARNL